MDPKELCYVAGLMLCFLAVGIWAEGNGLLAVLCTLSGIAIMFLGDRVH